MTIHTAFFGDRERGFRVTSKLIPELERATGAGIGLLCKRLFDGYFSHADIAETIRIGLIGAGEPPKRAAELVAVYVADRPLAETYPIAVGILEKLWFGLEAEADSQADIDNITNAISDIPATIKDLTDASE